MANNIFVELEKRADFLRNVDVDSARHRLAGVLNWLEGEPLTKSILDRLRKSIPLDPLLACTNFHTPPPAGSLEEISRVGLFFMEECREGVDLNDVAHSHGVEPRHSNTSLQSEVEEAMSRYIRPMFSYIKLSLVLETGGTAVPLTFEFDQRMSVLVNVHFAEAKARYAAFLNWIESIPVLHEAADSVRHKSDANLILSKAGQLSPPVASSPDEVVAIGVRLMERLKEGMDIFKLSMAYGIVPAYSSSYIQDNADTVINQYIDPAIYYFRNYVYEITGANIIGRDDMNIPPTIINSIKLFQADHPEPARVAFIMMQFGKTKAHLEITQSIKDCLKQYGIDAVRADDKEYHDDLFPNVLTYIYGCGFGIAVFERIEGDEFNPNVSLEVGYMMALDKPVCLLKDQTLKTLHTDLIGKLYKTFDPQNPKDSIPAKLEKWLTDKSLK